MIRTSPLLTSLFAAATLCACQSLNLPGRSISLKEAAGVLSEAEQALASGSPGNNPRVPSADEIVALYDQVWA